MDKSHILAEIKRTAQANGGRPLGSRRFAAETGIRPPDWAACWARWNDALREAGFSPNALTEAYEVAELLEKYARLALELGRLPTNADLRFKARNDLGFPSDTTFGRAGSTSEFVAQVAEYCRTRDEFQEVLRFCQEYVPRGRAEPDEPAADEVAIGFVYLIKSGRFYRIGKTNATGRREYEHGLKLPEPVKRVHVIRTDDPEGIEAYWHKRFETKHVRGDWFDLDRADIAAFKRRKFM